MSVPRLPASLVSVRLWMQRIAAISALVLVSGLWISPTRVWPDLLLVSYALICAGLAGLFFVALQYVSGAVWSIALRRVGEAMISALPVGAAGIFAVLLGHPSLYLWVGHPVTGAGGWAGFRQLWLSYSFFLIRAVLYISVWLSFAWAMLRNSRRQDREGGHELSRKNTRLAAAFMVVFGVSFWLASTDWIMTLEPDWSSTIFGIYQFSGMFLSGLAVLSLLAVWLRKAGPLRGGVTDQHFLDLGRLILAFATFWAYIWFSQYMLIWYANLPEETSYMAVRTHAGWGKLFVANLVLNWVLPFFLLLSRRSKMNPRTLSAAATIVLLGRLTDLYLMILPVYFPVSPGLMLWDFATLILVSSAFVLLTINRFFRTEPLPVGDPFLAESLHSHA